MIFGILTGFIAAALQSSSYVFSRWFILKHHGTLELVVYSQIAMGLAGLFLLPLAMPWGIFPLQTEFLCFLGGWLLSGTASQYCFFKTLRELEASRLSSLLGLKIIILALIYILLERRGLNALQWCAVFLSSFAGMGMNWSGGRISPRAGIWLLLTLLLYSISDIFVTKMVLSAHGPSLLMDSLGMTALIYFVLGLCSLPALLLKKVRKSIRLFRDSVPYALAWFLAMIFLFACFATLNVVFGNVIQATRCVISVLFGILLTRAGFLRLEPPVGKSAWLRRICASVLMLCAVFLYSWSGKGA